MRSFSTNGLIVPMNTRLALMNLSLTDSLMQLLLNELSLEDVDEETL